jgi:hypothetical protein
MAVPAQAGPADSDAPSARSVESWTSREESGALVSPIAAGPSSNAARRKVREGKSRAVLIVVKEESATVRDFTGFSG